MTAEGRISGVKCTPPAVLELTLDFGGGLGVQLRAGNYHKVEFLSKGWEAPANFNPCAHIRGLKAEIVYLHVPGEAQAGEIVSVEIRK